MMTEKQAMMEDQWVTENRGEDLMERRYEDMDNIDVMEYIHGNFSMTF